MINIMIVDDEGLIRAGLNRIIQRAGGEFIVTFMACDGEEALEKMEKESVDVVITDVSMPGMDGLDLISKIKEINRDVEYIILSGYDDFSYAKRGIALGVSNYILKPINEVELMNTLNGLKEKIKERRDLELSSKCMKDTVLREILTGEGSDIEYEILSREYDIKFNWEYYGVSIITFEEKAYPKEFLEKYNSDKRVLIIYKEDNYVCISGGVIGEEVKRGEESFLIEVIDEIKKETQSNVYITTGEIVKGYKNICKSYESAKDMQNYLLIDGFNNSIRFFREEKKLKNEEEKKLKLHLKEFHKLLIAKEIEEIKKYIYTQFKDNLELFKEEPKRIKEMAIRMVVTLEEVYEEFNIDNSFGLEKIICEINEIKVIEDMENKLLALCNNLVQKLRDNFKSKSPIINRILKVVKEEYSNDISLKVLGGRFNVNPTYLGQLFFKEVGCGFSDYLNKVKNEKAKELILNTDMKINEIAKVIGYTDTSYFYRKFKGYHGISPKTLRKNKKY